jgi:hypothetical protein
MSEDTVFSGGSTKSATYTFSNGGNGGGQIAIFKAASGGAVDPFPAGYQEPNPAGQNAVYRM